MESVKRRCSINLDSCIPGKCSSVQHGNELAALASTRYKEEHIAAYMKWLCFNCGRVCDCLGRTALHVVSSCGHCLIAYWLIRSMAANINFKDAESGYTSLHRAVFYGQIHVAVTLLKLGANAAIKDNEGLTPFDLIMKDKQYLMLKLPLDAGLNDVYVWGSNTNFNLGTGKQQSRSHPESLESFRKQHIKIKQVSMERFHTLFVSNDGKVYSCGHGQGGRLGLGTEQAALIPTQIHFQLHKHQSKDSDAKIKCIMASTGQDHSLFLTEGGLELYNGKLELKSSCDCDDNGCRTGCPVLMLQVVAQSESVSGYDTVANGICYITDNNLMNGKTGVGLCSSGTVLYIMFAEVLL